MAEWAELGLKCGLEIHQQFEGTKLFCKCPTTLRNEEPESRTVRRMRMAAGEIGGVDVAAAAEISKGKYFLYESYKDSTCLVELDETPPNQMNKDALFAILQLCKSLEARVTDRVQVMRKTVVDGSNTSGFQRTALVGRNGILEVEGKKISIPTIVLEEDSARIIGQDAHSTTYRLDRLGIPLVEMATGPDMHSPEEVKQVAKAIGMLIRSTGKAKRGLGTIRQDLNVSIKDGARVEIKGAQELGLLPTLTEIEANRQKILLEIRDELVRRKAHVNSPVMEVTKHVKDSESTVIKNALQEGGRVLAVKLSGFKGLLGREVQPQKRLGTELSDHAKVASGVKGLFHSDELPKYGITTEEKGAIATALECGGQDAFIMIAAEPEQASKGMDAAVARAQQALKGIPKQVRKANPDGTTSFLRPMPGAARMYPETDIPLIKIEDPLLRDIPIPESIPDRIKKYKTEHKLGNDLAEALAASNKGALFEELVKASPGVKPAYIAEVLIGTVKTIKRDFDVDANPSDDDYKALFKALQVREITKESVLEILKECKPVEEIISKYKVMSEDQVDEVLKKIVKDNPDKKLNVLMGIAMKELRGKASGQLISQRLKALASEQDT